MTWMPASVTVTGSNGLNRIPAQPLPGEPGSTLEKENSDDGAPKSRRAMTDFQVENVSPPVVSVATSLGFGTA